MTAPPDADHRIRRLVRRVLALNEPPARTASACAVGVFFSFSPYLGFQTLLAMTCAFALRLNKPLVFLALNTNLPWFMGPWYAGTTAAAAWLLGVGLPPEWDEVRLAFDQRALPQLHVWTGTLRALLWPFVIGGTAGAALLSAATYGVVRAMLRKKDVEGVPRST